MVARGREAALTLYRGILRAHKSHLPKEMRALGDAYIKSEFKLHKKVENSAQLDSFFLGWEVSASKRNNCSFCRIYC